MKIKNVRELFETELHYAYDCEEKLVKKGLPSMIEACSSPELRQALENHLEETRGHVSRLQQIFSVTGLEAKTKDNDIFDEMASAVKDTVSHIDASPLRDAALIVNGNQVEHYEIALYGSLVAMAKQLGVQSAVQPLEQTLTEEKAADAKLTEIAESTVNARAARAAGAA